LKITVRVPATTANLGPGFDALGLALDLWNEAVFSPADTFSVRARGEGAHELPHDSRNLIIQAAQRLAAESQAALTLPLFRVDCLNRIPPGAGLGSSAAAVLAGLLGANALLNDPFSREALLQMAAGIEGHPDNVAPALLGGVVVSTMDEGGVLARRVAGETNSLSHLHVTIVVPDFRFPTEEARAALPEQVSLKDAVKNIGRSILVAEALRAGDLELLSRVMEDALHQPYRLPLIPGARAAVEAAKGAGAAAVALSGAGPALAAFGAEQGAAIGKAMADAFNAAGLKARVLNLAASAQGAQVQVDP
jgi:homoserine kinase